MIDRKPPGLSLYLSRQAASSWRYWWEALVTTLFGRIATVVGIGLRDLAYRTILHIDGHAAIESGVRLRFASGIRLGDRAYLDEGVYLHACPGGIELGARTIVMHHAELHVYNFRGMPHSGIRVGADSLIGEFNVLRGQGGITIGDRVYFSPLVQVVAVNHVFDDPAVPFIQQGITAEGVVIEDDVWVGAGAVICDGVTVGRGAVVAAGAVVTGDVPPHTVVGGVPAKVLRAVGEGDAGAREVGAGDDAARQVGASDDAARPVGASGAAARQAGASGAAGSRPRVWFGE